MHVQPKKKIIFFGDSITELGVKPSGYILQLEQLVTPSKYNLIGKGISGNKIYDLYLRLEKDVIKEKPSAVFIWIGVNDVWHKQLLGTGTDLDKFVQFYQAIIDRMKQNKIQIYLITPLCIGEKKDASNPLDAELDLYSAAICKLAAKENIVCIDLRSEVKKYWQVHNPNNRSKNILTYDGVHLNDDGNEWVAQKLLPFLAQ